MEGNSETDRGIKARLRRVQESEKMEQTMNQRNKKWYELQKGIKNPEH